MGLDEWQAVFPLVVPVQFYHNSLAMPVAQLVRLNSLEQPLFRSSPFVWSAEREGRGLSRDSAEGHYFLWHSWTLIPEKEVLRVATA